MAALSISASALAQPAPAPAPEPAPPPTDPATPPANPTTTEPAPAPAPAPAPPPAPPAEPPKTVFPTMTGPFLRLNDIFSFRPGFLLQFWATSTQDNVPLANGDSGEFNKALYMRRARLFVAGTIGKNATWTVLMETSNLGLASANPDGTVTKSYTTPPAGVPVVFGLLEAYMDFKVHPNLSIQAGSMLIPFTRNILQSTSTYWTIDIGAVSATYINATQTNVLRDTGLQLKLTGAKGRLEARAMVSQGVKLPDAGRLPGKNDPRFTGYLQYNFLEPDSGYVFNGMYFGRKAIAGVALGGDYQKTGDENAYWATSATAFAAIPLKGADPKNGGDEVGGQIEFLHFHPGRLPVPIAALAKQNALLIEAGYYNKNAKLSVFGKFEGRFFTDERDFVPTMPDLEFSINNSRLFGGGLKYFLAEQVANVTLQYNYTQFPKAIMAINPRNSTSQIQLALQLSY